MNSSNTFKFKKIKMEEHPGIVLPQKFNDLDCYIKHNKPELLQYITDSIELAVVNDCDFIKLFVFHKNTHSVNITEHEFIINLEQCKLFFAGKEKYRSYYDKVEKLITTITKKQYGKKKIQTKTKKRNSTRKPKHNQ